MRRLALGLTAISFGIFGLVETMACNGDFDICVGDQCGATEGGSNDATDEQNVPPGCDLTKDPKDSAACVDDTIGLFVNGKDGSDANSGVKGAPLKTIGAAVQKADSQHTRIYVCAGAYTEGVKIATGSKVAGIFGGFSCSDWSYAGGAPNAVVTSTGGYALEVNNLNTNLTVEDVEFDSPDAQEAGASSIAVFITQSTGVILKRVNAKAGKGADGADAGTFASNFGGDGGLTAVTGLSATDDNGAAACVSACVDGTVGIGGAGGPGGAAGGGDGADGGPNIPPNSGDGKGGSYNASGSSCGTGDTGATAAGADAGTSGGSLGVVTASGWSVAPGSKGANGGPGQGGGGGSGGKNAGLGGGGGGGCGGCGGSGGSAGGNGGSSFAALVFQSTVTFDTCVVTAGAGANGKPGGPGQGGQAGGDPGLPAKAGAGCTGGTGGAGGGGAGGGGGAAGNSIALGYLGSQPTVMNSTFTKGSAGAAGTGGTGAAGNDGLAGADGMSAEQQDLKP